MVRSRCHAITLPRTPPGKRACLCVNLGGRISAEGEVMSTVITASHQASELN
jgi:hypothetical protein